MPIRDKDFKSSQFFSLRTFGKMLSLCTVLSIPLTAEPLHAADCIPELFDKLQFLADSWGNAAAEVSAGSPDLAAIPKSARVLMPEWEPDNLSLFAPIGASLLAWGTDPVFFMDKNNSLDSPSNPLKATLDRYRTMGVDRRAVNLWILTATAKYLYDYPELQSAVCYDIEGQKIIPAWIKGSDYRGVKPWWGCTNNPDFRANVHRRLEYAIKSGATMIHIDDHAGSSASSMEAGCFCPWCLGGFNLWLKTHITAAELKVEGIADPATFNYRTLLIGAGYGTVTRYREALWSGKLPLQAEYEKFQIESAAAFVAGIKAAARELAGKAVPVGVNSFNLHPIQLGDVRYVDYFSNELDHGAEDESIPAFAYRLGEGWNKPVFATATGWDWVDFKQHKRVNRVHGWIAQAYAFGEYFMYSWKKWGYTEQTGTMWTIVEPKVFTPTTDFIRDNAALFDGFQNAAAIGLIYDNDFAAVNQSVYWTINRECLEAGVPIAVIPLDSPNAVKIAQTMSTLIMPDGLDKESLASAGVPSGTKVITWSDFKTRMTAVKGRIVLKTTGDKKIWTLPRFNATTGSLSVHVLNRNYRSDNDTWILAKHITLIIPRSLMAKSGTADRADSPARTDDTVSPLGAASPVGANGSGEPRAVWNVPGKPAQSVELKVIGDSYEVVLDNLDYWGILSITP